MQHVVGIEYATLDGIGVSQVAADYGQPACLSTPNTPWKPIVPVAPVKNTFFPAIGS